MRASLLVLFGLCALVTAKLNYAGTVDTNTDRPGADLPNMPMNLTSFARAEDCQWYCTNDVKCKSWSFDSCGTKCWLKSEIKPSEQRTCRTSGVLTRADPSITITKAPTPPKPTSQEPPKPKPTTDAPKPTVAPKPTGNATHSVPRPTYTTAPNSCAYKNGLKMNGSSFASNFDFHTGADPTHGSVEYLSYELAQKYGLWKVNKDGSVYIGVDHENIKPNGRASVRITTKKAFGMGLLIVDLAHMPAQACGVWPSLWTTGPQWPKGGEIDIIEYVNHNKLNLMSLHTAPKCTIERPANSQFGTPKGTDCAVASATTGCGAQGISESAIGGPFNKAGGGVYAIERTDKHIKIWFFSKSENYPKSLLSANPNPCEFGMPAAYFPYGNTCTADHFGPQNLVLNTAFCGDWADAKGLFSAAGCPGTCQSYVANNPHAFDQAYWQVNSVRFYAA